MREHANLKSKNAVINKKYIKQPTIKKPTGSCRPLGSGNTLIVNSPKGLQSGVTLIELVITIVVMGIAMAALISSLSVGIGRSSQPMWEGKALELSQAYLDEILAMTFDGQTPVGGGQVLAAQNPCTFSDDGQSRELYDDVDDYHGVSDAPPVLIDSTIDMSRYANYQVDISVACAGTDLGLDSNDMAKRITVTVSVPSGETRSVAIYKGNY
jgi:MSHA pilin protein MshD